MKFNHKTKQNLLLATSFFSVISAAPSQAFTTIASSESGFMTENYSTNPLNVGTSAFTVSFTEAVGSTTIAEADGGALFTIIDPFSISETRGFAAGEGNNFFGLADSTAEVIGSFLVDSNEPFSFDFNGFLDIATFTESQESRDAIAAASISFILLDTNETSEPNIVSFFDVFAQLETLGENDILIAPQQSDDITLNFLNSNINAGATENSEFITTEFAGSLSTSFDTPTSLTLVEVSNSFVSVRQTPESTSILGILGLGFLGFVATKKRHF